MAPLGFQQTTLPPTMTVGSCSLTPQLAQLPPSHFTSLPSPRASAVHDDHDYVIKPKVMEQTMSLDMEEPFSDALLSSSALDFESIMSDLDFTDDLADLNLGLDHLEAGDDFSMEGSFQDFIDSALDKSFCPQQWEAEEASARERAAKEDFMRAIGLMPVLTTGPSEAAHTGPQVCEVPTSSVASIPTKECKCSQTSDGSRAMYTTAGLRSPNLLSTSTSQFRIPPHPAVFDSASRVIGPCLNCIQNRDVLKEFSKPLTIDVSTGHNVLTFQCHEEGHRLSEPETLQDPEEEELFQWLNASQSSVLPPSTQGATTYNNSTPQGSRQENVDFESYMDLEDLLNDELPSSNNPCQPPVQHDHTYQKAASRNNYILSQDGANISSQSTLSQAQESPNAMEAPILKDSFLELTSQISAKQQELNDSSLSSEQSSPSSSPASSPFPSPDSTRFHYQDGLLKSEKDHLDILNFFSDDLSSSMLSAGSPVAHLRFM